MEKKVVKLTEKDLVHLVEAAIKKVKSEVKPVVESAKVAKPTATAKQPKTVQLSEKELVTLIESAVKKSLNKA